MTVTSDGLTNCLSPITLLPSSSAAALVVAVSSSYLTEVWLFFPRWLLTFDSSFRRRRCMQCILRLAMASRTPTTILYACQPLWVTSHAFHGRCPLKVLTMPYRNLSSILHSSHLWHDRSHRITPKRPPRLFWQQWTNLLSGSAGVFDRTFVLVYCYGYDHS